MTNIIHEETLDLDTKMTLDDNGLMKIVTPTEAKEIMLPSVECRNFMTKLLKFYFMEGGMYIFKQSYHIQRHDTTATSGTKQDRTVYTPTDFPVMVVAHEIKGQLEFENFSKTDENSIKIIPRLKVLYAKEEFSGWITLSVKVTQPEAEELLKEWNKNKSNLSQEGQKNILTEMSNRIFKDCAKFINENNIEEIKSTPEEK